MRRVFLLILSLLPLFTFAQCLKGKSILIVKDVEKYQTIEDLLSLPQFKNKVVYIDIWATYCAPCIKDFAQSMNLKKKLENKSVAFLYICYDNVFSSRTKWLKLINSNSIFGTHVFCYIKPPNIIVHTKEKPIDSLIKQASDKSDTPLKISLTKQFINAPEYGTPTYLIANKKGKIVDYFATRPGNINTYNKLRKLEME